MLPGGWFENEPWLGTTDLWDNDNDLKWNNLFPSDLLRMFKTLNAYHWRPLESPGGCHGEETHIPPPPTPSRLGSVTFPQRCDLFSFTWLFFSKYFTGLELCINPAVDLEYSFSEFLGVGTCWLSSRDCFSKGLNVWAGTALQGWGNLSLKRPCLWTCLALLWPSLQLFLPFACVF